jgi:hypothetical protein
VRLVALLEKLRGVRDREDADLALEVGAFHHCALGYFEEPQRRRGHVKLNLRTKIDLGNGEKDNLVGPFRIQNRETLVYGYEEWRKISACLVVNVIILFLQLSVY